MSDNYQRLNHDAIKKASSDPSTTLPEKTDFSIFGGGGFFFSTGGKTIGSILDAGKVGFFMSPYSLECVCLSLRLILCVMPRG